jgi:hypothetical protein
MFAKQYDNATVVITAGVIYQALLECQDVVIVDLAEQMILDRKRPGVVVVVRFGSCRKPGHAGGSAAASGRRRRKSR